ncbi:hypothetical protein SSBR45G_22900 [Bradyrhizobium sp. SSBR45G]|uniref:hypothetical protein n=1 Tax=unclassified Bradyrhizobium TaxID=2631580 RepID=UPI002342A6FA|nr:MULTISPECIES: hypothetical protein [unclassified Bradyrhizobium]GLH77382.1 hypothetical protein SSBR45G_22900 [Bradyrhizobium sp. SSBR45G]GLH84512.1 hypothetical protein SSBR45R_19720 [Bradyrhizobium sp. SSBR45R]
MNETVADLSPAAAPTQRDDVATVAAAGILAATLAAFCHETIGHGIGCIAAGAT